jgi:hypothetical protein
MEGRRMKIGLKLAVLLLLSCPASATETEVEVATGVVCNTQKEIERLVALNDDNPLSAIKAVNNEEHDPTACAMASFAFVRGRDAITVRTRNGAFQITKILVVGVVTEDTVQSIVPAIQFSLLKIDERIA